MKMMLNNQQFGNAQLDVDDVLEEGYDVHDMDNTHSIPVAMQNLFGKSVYLKGIYSVNNDNVGYCCVNGLIPVIYAASYRPFCYPIFGYTTLPTAFPSFQTMGAATDEQINAITIYFTGKCYIGNIKNPYV